MNGMKIAICDDEKIMQEYLKEEIDSYFQSMDVLTLCYSSGEELLADYEKQQYDMVFLDIEMKGLNGLQVAKLLHAWKKDLPIVMVTTHTELAMEGYEVQAFRFLAKPVKREKLYAALMTMEERMYEDEKIQIVSDGLQRYIPCTSVCFIKCENVYLNIVTINENYLIRKKLKEFMEELPKELFFQVHRSYVVNLNFVESFDGANVYMKGGMKIPVSKAKREDFKIAMIHHMKRRK